MRSKDGKAVGGPYKSARGEVKYFTYKAPQFKPTNLSLYILPCKDLVYFFDNLVYPVGAVQLPNGIVTYNLKKYVYVIIDCMRNFFIKGIDDIFLRFFSLLTSIKDSL